MRMNTEILNVINAVMNYQRFICSNQRIFKNDNFDWYSETKKYFETIPLPKGLKHNRDTLEKILCYGLPNRLWWLNALNGMQEEELSKYHF